MKKLSLLFVILFISFSFGQTKKKEPIVKQSDNEEVMRNTIKGNPDLKMMFQQL